MQRLLFVFSKLNPGLEYVQGMNDLIAPLYMVFKDEPAEEADAHHAEADTFFCFVNLLTMSEMRDLYCKSLDRSATGVKAVLGEYVTFAPPCADESVLASAEHLLQLTGSWCDSQYAAHATCNAKSLSGASRPQKCPMQVHAATCRCRSICCCPSKRAEC